MSEMQKRDWLMVLCAGAVAVFIVLYRSKQQTATQAADPQPAINMPAAAVTPDYLTYNLPAAQKSGLVLPTVTPLAAAAQQAGGLPALRSRGSRPAQLGLASNEGGGGCGCPPKCKGGASANRVGSVEQLEKLYMAQVPDFSARYLANMATAFPQFTAQAAMSNGGN